MKGRVDGRDTVVREDDCRLDRAFDAHKKFISLGEGVNKAAEKLAKIRRDQAYAHNPIYYEKGEEDL